MTFLAHYKSAEKLAAQSYHFTYGDGADPVTGNALATLALAHATMAQAAATAMAATQLPADGGTAAAIRRALVDRGAEG